jgi:phosphate transport system substrate-binding protein
MTSLRRILGVGLGMLSLGVIGIGFVGCGPSSTGTNNSGGSGAQAAPGGSLTGGGSSFVRPMMDKWTKEYGKAKKITLQYNSVGSGGGVKGMTDKTMDFGCTDAPLTDEQLKIAKEKNGDVIQVPLVAGAVVPIYNLPEVKEPLKFTGEVLGDIYLDKITMWNDAKIKELNPGVELPATKITSVHRSDPSGTTYIFTDFLAKTNKTWEDEYKAGKTEVAWKAGQGEAKNDGVANFVKGNAGAIGYVELDYALSNKIAFGSVKNKAGKFVLGSAEAVTAALSNLQEIPENLTFNLNNQPGDATYPICGCVWAAMFVKQPADKAKLLKDFFGWAVTDGQAFAGGLNYASLPPTLVDKIKPKLELLK